MAGATRCPPAAPVGG